MPIEIKELHIRVAIEPTPENRAAGGASRGAGSAPSPESDAVGHEAIVNECVEQVMRILRLKSER